MQPYWLTFKNAPKFSGLGFGAGITAYSEDDARDICAKAFGSEHQLKEIRRIQTMDEIEQNHVRPNMGNFFARGVWFPLGFS